MATTTVTINVEEKRRLEYYKGVFGFSSIQECLKGLLDKAGLASYADIQRLQTIQREGRE